MNVSRMGRRLAVSGVATAIAAAGMVGASTAAANAATGSADYTCNFPAPLGAQSVPVDLSTIDISSVFPTIPAGTPIPAGTLTGSYLVHPNSGVLSVLSNVSSVASPDMTMLMSNDAGDIAVPVQGFGLGAPTQASDGSMVVPGSGSNGAFSLPGAGVYQLTMPKAFSLVATTPLGDVTVPCSTSAAPGLLDTLTVVKNASTTSAKATKTSFRRGTVAKIKATVSGDTLAPSGNVTAVSGSKTYKAKLNNAGVAMINLGKKLTVGKHKFTVKYVGSDFHKASKAPKAVVVKVVK